MSSPTESISLHRLVLILQRIGLQTRTYRSQMHSVCFPPCGKCAFNMIRCFDARVGMSNLMRPYSTQPESARYLTVIKVLLVRREGSSLPSNIQSDRSKLVSTSSKPVHSIMKTAHFSACAMAAYAYAQSTTVCDNNPACVDCGGSESCSEDVQCAWHCPGAVSGQGGASSGTETVLLDYGAGTVSCIE